MSDFRFLDYLFVVFQELCFVCCLCLSSCLFRVCINSCCSLQNIHQFFLYIYYLLMIRYMITPE
ncbi:hypothetical protein F5890DRAFT_1530624 [Lentinula detonsa]|uniref:Uncharacterized protein n=1 Tax=Lentinula detonsa TaxID=2804962 RepID=A0AA38PV56_9AGAR|nr:hypothetical protein F5890DRAFT_1530624 [Lentinula detonsa]